MNAIAAVQYLRERPRALKIVQLTLLVLTLVFCAWAVQDQWSKAGPLLANANPSYLALSFGVVAVYYLVFILGWVRMLDAWGIQVSYRVALQAEMVSMLAKYLPGGVWTPAARAVALRRYGGVTDTPTVLASILVEAALSAISGVIVFVLSLAWVRDVNAPLLPLVGFAVLLAALLHPRVFRPLFNKILKPFGAHNIEPLPFHLTIGLLLFYCGTWVIGGFAVYFMLRSVGAEVGLETIPFLGGVSHVGSGARRDADQPPRDHARRGIALRRRPRLVAARPRPAGLTLSSLEKLGQHARTEQLDAAQLVDAVRCPELDPVGAGVEQGARLLDDSCRLPGERETVEQVIRDLIALRQLDRRVMGCHDRKIERHLRSRVSAGRRVVLVHDGHRADHELRVAVRQALLHQPRHRGIG
jgi:uncharacterized membrane protein YbhN (UPF0104 family)